MVNWTGLADYDLPHLLRPHRPRRQSHAPQDVRRAEVSPRVAVSRGPGEIAAQLACEAGAGPMIPPDLLKGPPVTVADLLHSAAVLRRSA